MLLAAAQLGAQQGLDEVQMAQVADRAGVALGTLYRYYPSKHHLFAALLTMRTAELAAPAGRGPGACRRQPGGRGGA